MKVLFTGGGTGGHIFPIVAVARELKKIYPKKDLKIFYIGPRDDFAEVLLEQEEIKVKTIFSGKIRRYFSLANIFDILFKIPLGTLQAFLFIFFLNPDLIFSKGGYGSIPAVFSGWLLGTPVFLHESDIAPGLANKFLSKFALEIFVSFPTERTEYFPPSKMVWVGNPVRVEIGRGKKESAEDIFKLTFEKPVVLILGGSQGAKRINDLVLLTMPDILKNFEIIHQTGKNNFKEVQLQSKVVIPKQLEKYYHPFPFLEEGKLKHAYAVAELVIGRAGSGIIFELAFLKKPSILVPLPGAAQSHQLRNAYYYAQKGAATVIEEENLTPHFFLEKLKLLFARTDELKEMSKKAEQFSMPRAASIIAEYVLTYLKA